MENNSSPRNEGLRYLPLLYFKRAVNTHICKHRKARESCKIFTNYHKSYQMSNYKRKTQSRSTWCGRIWMKLSLVYGFMS